MNFVDFIRQIPEAIAAFFKLFVLGTLAGLWSLISGQADIYLPPWPWF